MDPNHPSPLASAISRDLTSAMTQPAPLSLRTKIQGDPSQPTLLCLHGHPGSGDCMAVFTQALSSQFRTLAPDLRGYGKSKAPGPFAMETHLDDLEALLAQEQVGEFYLLGWSLGGILALELALRDVQAAYANRVKGIILIATAAHPRSNHPATSWVEDLLTGVAGLINAVLPGAQWNIDLFGKRSLFRYLVQQQTPATYRYLAQYALPAYLQTSRWAHKALGDALKARYNRLEDLPAIPCPCLMLAGEQDCHITASSSLETAQQLPHCQSKVYSDVAHLFPWEIPQQVVADIQDWLDSLKD